MNLPNGSYKDTCFECKIENNIGGITLLNCFCKKLNNSLQNTFLIYPTYENQYLYIINNDGDLSKTKNNCRNVCKLFYF